MNKWLSMLREETASAPTPEKRKKPAEGVSLVSLASPRLSLKKFEGAQPPADDGPLSRCWRLTLADGTEREVKKFPALTRAHVFRLYPEAVAAEPFVRDNEIIKNSPTPTLEKLEKPARGVSLVSLASPRLSFEKFDGPQPPVNPGELSRWWKLHCADGTEKEIGRFPDSTRAEVLALYPDAVAAEPFVPVIRRPSTPLTAVEELAIRQWLAQIGETDPLTIAEAIDRCRREADSRETFLRVAYAALPPPDLSDDRRLCLQCRNLSGARCLAWRQIGAGPRYEPFLDQKLRCVAYAPDSTDPDQRPGLQRWPGLLVKWED